MPQGANSMFIPLILLFAFMYFMIIRPQYKQRKKRMQMLDNLKAGDQIVTIGGIFGKIVEINDSTIKLEVAQDLCLKMQREAVGYMNPDTEQKQE